MTDTRDPLAITATAARLRALHDAGVLDEAARLALLRRAAAGPDAEGWRRHLDRLALELGAGLIVVGVIYFFAANWAALPRLAKIGGVAAMMSAAAAWALYAPNRLSGRVALSAAGGLLGALLAVYGQVYQTGADAWTLFAAWAVLLIPWVIASRYPPLLLKWLGIIALALHLAVEQGALPLLSQKPWPWLAPTLAPALAWIIAEAGVVGRGPLYFLRVVGAAAFAGLTLSALILIIDEPKTVGAPLLTLLGLAAAGAWSLNLVGRRPFDLVLACLAWASAVIITTTLLGRLLFDALSLYESGVLALAVAIIAQVALAAYWLRARWRRAPS
ncbi:DUF2157 domain-containing protein [Myxococcota bacterium]|nr:DUF2157 domain-containing protein [Myxococcota bacterium]MBU1430390.1 DUF2157 domain-containing protein [Myxococcota bacterium]MBU1897694.1 DUF2157 domain-containing protein [Myxococcota bacterium]